MNVNETIKVEELLVWWLTYFGKQPRVFELKICPLKLNGDNIINLQEIHGGVRATMATGYVDLRITRKEIEDLIPEEERFQQSIW